MVKNWFNKAKKFIVNWWKKFKQKKLNIALLVAGSLFVVSAIFSRLVPVFSVVALASLIAAVVMVAYHYQKMHKENKCRFLVAMHKDALTENEIKVVKRQLRSLKIVFIVLYLISLSFIVMLLENLSIL